MTSGNTTGTVNYIEELPAWMLGITEGQGPSSTDGPDPLGAGPPPATDDLIARTRAVLGLDARPETDGLRTRRSLASLRLGSYDLPVAFERTTEVLEPENQAVNRAFEAIMPILREPHFIVSWNTPDEAFQQSVPPLPQEGISLLSDLPVCANALCGQLVTPEEGSEPSNNQWNLCTACRVRPQTWACDGCQWVNTILYADCVACGYSRLAELD